MHLLRSFSIHLYSMNSYEFIEQLRCTKYLLEECKCCQQSHQQEKISSARFQKHCHLYLFLFVSFQYIYIYIFSQMISIQLEIKLGTITQNSSYIIKNVIIWQCYDNSVMWLQQLIMIPRKFSYFIWGERGGQNPHMLNSIKFLYAKDLVE